MEIHLGYSTAFVFLLTVLQSCCGFRCPMPMGNFPMIQSESCEVYWKCRGGMAIAEQCKPGEQFSYMKGMCLPQKFVGCIVQRKFLIQALNQPKPAPMQQQPQQKSRPIILFPFPLPPRPTKRPAPAATQAPNTPAPPPTQKPWPQPFPFPEPPCGAPPAPPCGGTIPGPCGAPPAPPCGGLPPGPCGAPPAPPCGGGAPPPFPGSFPGGASPFGQPPGFFSFSQNGFQNGLPPLATRILRRVLG